MVQISFKIDGEKQLSRNLRLFVDKIENLQPFYKEAIDIVAARKDAVFSAQGSNVQKGPKRAALASSTQLARSRGRGHYKKAPNNPGVLRWTGNLQDNTTTTITDRYGSFEMNAPYAIYHQRWWGKLPKRPILDLDNETNAEIVRALQKKINTDIKWIFGLQA